MALWKQNQIFVSCVLYIQNFMRHFTEVNYFYNQQSSKSPQILVVTLIHIKFEYKIIEKLKKILFYICLFNEGEAK